MPKTIHKLISVLFIGAMFLLAGCQVKQEPQANKGASLAPPFPERDIILVVPYSAGGGFDTYARMFQPYFQKNLPQKVNVVVKNVTGGETKLGLMEIYKAKPDGYTIGMFDIPGQVSAQVLGTAQYDLNKVNWLARLSDSPQLMALSPKSAFKSVQDLQKAEVVKAGTGGLSTTAGLSAIIAAQEMGIKLNPIPQDGVQESILAAIRGDIDFVLYPLTSLRQAIQNRDIVPFMVFSRERVPDMPDVPTASESGYPQLLDTVKMDYMLGATPGIPDEIVKILREATWKAINDPEFKDVAARAKRSITNPAPGEEVGKLVQQTMDAYSKHKDLLQKYTAK